MSENKNLTMADIRLRKQRLKDDLELLEDGFENRVKHVKSDILETINPSDAIKKAPLKAVGLAIAAGLILGLSRPGKRKKPFRKKDSQEHENLEQAGIPAYAFSSLLMDEVKRIAARRAASYISELMDERFRNKESN